MNINHKQKELIEYFYKTAKEKFPEIDYKDLSESPDDPDHIWINVISNMNEEREIEFWDFASQIEADLDTDYGYRISIMLENPNPAYI